MPLDGLSDGEAMSECDDAADERPGALDELFLKHSLRAQHSVRFQKVAMGYPRRVALAYDRNLVQAALDTDEQVAATVAEWERANGLEVQDWLAVGREERGEDEED